MIGFVFKQKSLRTEPRSGALAHAFVVSNYLLIAKNMLITGSAALYQMNSLLNLLIAGISLFLYLRAVIVEERRIRFTACQIAIVGGLGLFWLVSFLLNTDLLRYSYVRDELMQFIIYALPALLFLPTLRDCSNLMKHFYRYRWAMLAAATLSVVMILISGEIQGAGSRYAVYSMSFGRAVMFVCVVFLSSWFAQFNWRDFVGSVLCVVYILAFGSRFPLLCIGCFVIWKLLRSIGSFKNLLRSKLRWWLLAGLIAIAALLLFWTPIFGAIHACLLSFGINSRTIALMASGNLATIIYDSGRREIYEALLAKVNLSPIFGYGAGGSNVVLDNGLSHSFVFDVFGNMGYVLGGIFLTASVYVLFAVYLVRKHKSDRAFMDICLCLFVPICLVQTSLWRASNFWMLVALYAGTVDCKKQWKIELPIPSKIEKIFNPYLILTHLCRYWPFNSVSDEIYLKLFYRAHQDRPLHLDEPKSFNEKLQWLKLNDRNPEYTALSDKYLVRQAVADKIGEKYLIPLLGAWDSVEEIPFRKLPKEFVLKCNHDSGSVVVCKDKATLDVKAAKRKLARALERQYYWKSREYNYKNIKRKIIAEKLMKDAGSEELTDYKFFCFHGEPKFVQVDSGRFTDHIRNFYTADWEFIDVKYGCKNDPNCVIPKPDKLDEMLMLARKLSEDFLHVRVDFYVANGDIYFGELTFHHGGGVMRVEPYAYDELWGSYLVIP